MYARSYVQTLRNIENCVHNSLNTMNSLDSSKSKDTIDIILETLTEYAIVFSEVEFYPPNSIPKDSDLVNICLNEMRTVGPLTLDHHSLPKFRKLNESDRIEVVENYVLIPLDSSGERAYTWIPMLKVLKDILQSISADLSRLAMRARTDCSNFYANTWTVAYHTVELLSIFVSIETCLEKEKIEFNNTKSILQK